VSRRRRWQFSDLFNFDGEDFSFGREPVEGGSGYSIIVTHDKEGKPVVRVEAHGDVDIKELRKDIEQRYPGARIEGLEKQPLIRIVDDKKEKNKTESKEEKENKGKPFIRAVK